MMTIGELAGATGVAASALRYWEELGLLPAPARVGGQRRYPTSAVAQVGQILVLQDSGFRLRELKAVLAAWSEDSDAWRALAESKIAELDDRIARAQAARTALAHGLACRHDDLRDCPTGARIVEARLVGTPLADAHHH